MNLGDVIAELLDEVDDVEVLATREYARNGVPFAWRSEEDVLELRLGPEIADAALRTPGTEPSSRGEAWLKFKPGPDSQHDRDRLEAWFRVAWRLAEKR
jgi:hypothetical protein